MHLRALRASSARASVCFAQGFPGRSVVRRIERQWLNPALQGVRSNRQIFTFSATADASARAQEAASIGGATATIATMPRDERLAALRAEMAAAAGGAGVQAYIIPSEDPHMSEYAPDCYKRREFISRFTGSAGTAVVTPSAACLWTDGRYFLQGEQELGPEWTLMRAGSPGVPEIEEWLCEAVPPGGAVGVDPFCHTLDAVRKLSAKLEATGRRLVPLLEGGNLVDRAWKGQPAAPKAPMRVHPLQWAGESVSSKLSMIRDQLARSRAGGLLVTSLDDVAWLFNLRGSDVAYNPVFLSYGIVTPETATLYVDVDKITPEVAAHLKESGVATAPYEAALTDVRRLAGIGAKLWIDPAKVSYAMYQAAREAISASNGSRGKKRTADDAEVPAAAGAASQGATFVEAASPIVHAKAIKNDAELAGFREAHTRDAVAMCDFLCFLETQVAAGRTFTEVQIDEELTARRAQQPGFLEPSFATIAGAGPNGAIIHYRAQPGTCRTVDSQTLLLLDSGGQYDCGTTDITRTLHLGSPTAHQRRCFTLVLKGHIGLDTAVFPDGTPGMAIDCLARLPLWSDGLNYRHGTGHGVGAALNVHEGPQSISTRYWITVPLAPGMVCSNEPGYYEDGGFGIRIENLMAVREAETRHQFGGAGYNGFERLTLVPIQTKMMDTSLLTKKEVDWIDGYHAQVWSTVSPRLPAGKTLDWLRAATRPLAQHAKA